MTSRLLDLPANISVIGGVAAALVVATIACWPSKLDSIPTVGSNGWLSSLWAGLKYVTHAIDILQEGHEKHKSAPFKITALYRWMVVLNGRDHVEELHRAPVDTLSFGEFLRDRLQLDYTMGPEISNNPYHVQIVRSQLTRNIGVLYPEIRSEIMTTFDEVLDLKGKEWKGVVALRSVQEVICRTSNRVIVGLPLCRNPDWIDLNIQYTVDVNKGSVIIALFPDQLKPIATRLFTNVNQGKQRIKKLLSPIIEERRKHLNKHSHEWADKPNDFLSWLMEEAEGPELAVERLTNRILFINAAAIQTSSISFTHALLYLAANPQYIQPLREEVEGIIEKEGWSKAALDKMRKVDSFLRECQRIEGISCVSLQRTALKDFTFSDGTFVPRGTLVATATRSTHRNEALYENALEFDPFRFAQLSEEDGHGAKYQYTSTSVEYLPFGHGRQACPGRFFAASELKTMLAHIVVTYDVKLEDNATRPQSLRFVAGVLPDPRAIVMFRRRVE